MSPDAIIRMYLRERRREAREKAREARKAKEVERFLKEQFRSFAQLLLDTNAEYQRELVLYVFSHPLSIQTQVVELIVDAVVGGCPHRRDKARGILAQFGKLAMLGLLLRLKRLRGEKASIRLLESFEPLLPELDEMSLANLHAALHNLGQQQRPLAVLEACERSRVTLEVFMVRQQRVRAIEIIADRHFGQNVVDASESE
jgi:hypothetical protein